MHLEYLHEGIAYYENGLSDYLCQDVWEFYYRNIDSLALPGVTMSGSNGGTEDSPWKHTLDQDMKRLSQCDESLIAERSNIDDRIYQELKLPVSDYLNIYDQLAKAPNIVDTGYLWQMYRKNDGYYKEHVDGDNWNHDTIHRVAGIVCYINTVDEGGETYFRYQDHYIKPKKGGVAIFPASWMYPHEAMMPISSDKLILSSFLVCQPVETHRHF